MSRASRRAAAQAAIQSPAPLPPTSRPALRVALGLALVGLGLSLWLARLHVHAHAGETSFCSISATVNCDKVATSPWSVVLGLPVAVWGAFGYGLAALLAGRALAGRRPHPGWPAGLLFVVAGLAVAASAALALVSELVIGAWCLLCIGSWLTAAALLVAAWRAIRARGVGASVRADVGAIRAHPARPALFGAAALAVLVLAGTLYPRYWASAAARAPVAGAPGARPGDAAARAGGTPAGVPAPAPSRPGETVVVVYSDYECPFCARSHADVRQLLAGRDDVRLVRRQFPLDMDCNPIVKRPIHPHSCELARAGICAEAQGKLELMEDALFGNQQEGLPIDALARRTGLDLPAFQACLAAPATAAKLAADIDAGLRDGIKATPSYVVGGLVYSGQLPPQTVPPRPSGAAATR